MASDKAPPESMALAHANNDLAVHLHRLLAEEKTNVFFSPFSISTAMSMVLCAAEGETGAEIAKALGYDLAGISKENLASAVQLQMSTFSKNQNAYTLCFANSLLSDKRFLVKDNYKLILSQAFQALLVEVDFANDGEGALEKINSWVKEKTNNMIPKLLDSCLDPNTVMVLLNAVYFKGSWLRKFDKESTVHGKFFNSGNEKKATKVHMMKMKESFPFAEKETYKALQLPYVGGDIVLLILLPNRRDGLDQLEANLMPSFIHDLSQCLRSKKVKLTLPRFRMEYSKSLLPSFQRLGVRRLFIEGAELGGASDSKGLLASDIFHKAVLEVNEEGSEAAAATMVPITLRCLPPEPPVFTVDHPFAFAIYNTKSNLILFMGRVDTL